MKAVCLFLLFSFQLTFAQSIPTSHVACDPSYSKEVLTCTQDQGTMSEREKSDIRGFHYIGMIRLLKICKLNQKDANTHTHELVFVRDHQWGSQHSVIRGFQHDGGRFQFRSHGSNQFQIKVANDSKSLEIYEVMYSSDANTVLKCQ